MFNLKCGPIGHIKSLNIGGLIFFFLKMTRNCNFTIFLSLKLCLHSMCRAKSAWLPSMCGAKSALLPSMCGANLQTLLRTWMGAMQTLLRTWKGAMQTSLRTWSGDIGSSTKNLLKLPILPIFTDSAHWADSV